MMLVRDRAGLLKHAAASVLAQSEPSFELLILDDGSTDDTWSVAEQLAAADPRVRLLRNFRSAGIPAARNQVLAEARGRVIAICDSDDVSRPDRFAAQLAALDADPELVGVGGRFELFETAPRSGSEPSWHWGLRDGRLPFAFPTAMLRADSLREVGGFDERWPVAEDLQLAYRLAAAGGSFALVNEVVLDYRVHAGSSSSRALRREWNTLRAQLFGLRILRGRFTLRGYLVLVQSALRCVLAALGLRR